MSLPSESESPASGISRPSPFGQISALLDRLCTGLYDREEAVRLALLASIAGESIFLLGPPGVGKSLVARRLKHAFASGRAFEYLMTRFSTPDEIFGPVSIKKLREEDRYERRIEGYLPGSDVIFLDEIWKAGPAIQNALLTVLNERVYRNGDQDVRVAVRAILTASNELPPEGASLSPLWDRFLFRYAMEGIRGGRAFLSMIVDTRDVYADNVEPELKLSTAQLDAWSQEIDRVEVPAEVLNVVQVVRHRIETSNDSGAMPDGPLKIYDRRWKKLIRLLRTSAFLHGRPSVNLMDCFLLPHALWSQPSQQDTLREMVQDAVHKHGYSLAAGVVALRAELEELDAEITAETEVVHTVTVEQPLLVDDEHYTFVKSEPRFQATRMKAADYRRLDEESDVVVNFFDDEGNLRHRVHARRGAADHSVQLKVQGKTLTVRVKTQLQERPERIRRTPHPLLVAHWTKRMDRLFAEVTAQQERLRLEEPPQLQHTRTHLFVDAALGRIVRANHERVVGGFERMQLQLEKARFRMLRDVDA